MEHPDIECTERPLPSPLPTSAEPREQQLKRRRMDEISQDTFVGDKGKTAIEKELEDASGSVITERHSPQLPLVGGSGSGTPAAERAGQGKHICSVCGADTFRSKMALCGHMQVHSKKAPRPRTGYSAAAGASAVQSLSILATATVTRGDEVQVSLTEDYRRSLPCEPPSKRRCLFNDDQIRLEVDAIVPGGVYQGVSFTGDELEVAAAFLVLSKGPVIFGPERTGQVIISSSPDDVKVQEDGQFSPRHMSLLNHTVSGEEIPEAPEHVIHDVTSAAATDEKKQFRCSMCPSTFPTRQALGGHVSYHNRVKKTTGEPVRADTKNRLFVCPECKATFNKSQALGGHMGVHSQRPPRQPVPRRSGDQIRLSAGGVNLLLTLGKWAVEGASATPSAGDHCLSYSRVGVQSPNSSGHGDEKPLQYIDLNEPPPMEDC